MAKAIALISRNVKIINGGGSESSIKWRKKLNEISMKIMA
jgi:hypothetical protein